METVQRSINGVIDEVGRRREKTEDKESQEAMLKMKGVEKFTSKNNGGKNGKIFDPLAGPKRD